MILLPLGFGFVWIISISHCEALSKYVLQHNKGSGTIENQCVSVYLDKFSEQSLKRKFEAVTTRVLLLQAVEGTQEAWLYLFSLLEQRQVREKSNRKSLKGNNLYIQIIFYQDTKLEPKYKYKHKRALCSPFASRMTQYVWTICISGDAKAFNYRHDFHSRKHPANWFFPWTVCPIFKWLLVLGSRKQVCKYSLYFIKLRCWRWVGPFP